MKVQRISNYGVVRFKWNIYITHFFLRLREYSRRGKERLSEPEVGEDFC